jgi:CCR4-NOT transcription complex subunit 3
MERFKACEKEMKTKAFSKEGLSAGHRLDPREALKQETVTFISAQVDELSRQVESTEAEIEQLQGGARKGKKGAAGNAERVSELEEQNDRRNWHISRLELINRLMENGNLDPDRVQGLKEDISYYVESNTVSTQSAGICLITQRSDEACFVCVCVSVYLIGGGLRGR